MASWFSMQDGGAEGKAAKHLHAASPYIGSVARAGEEILNAVSELYACIIKLDCCGKTIAPFLLQKAEFKGVLPLFSKTGLVESVFSGEAGRHEGVQ